MRFYVTSNTDFRIASVLHRQSKSFPFCKKVNCAKFAQSAIAVHNEIYINDLDRKFSKPMKIIPSVRDSISIENSMLGKMLVDILGFDAFAKKSLSFFDLCSPFLHKCHKRCPDHISSIAANSIENQ